MLMVIAGFICFLESANLVSGRGVKNPDPTYGLICGQSCLEPTYDGTVGGTVCCKTQDQTCCKLKDDGDCYSCRESENNDWRKRGSIRPREIKARIQINHFWDKNSHYIKFAEYQIVQ